MLKFDDVFDVVFNVDFVCELERALAGLTDLENIFIEKYVPLLEDKNFNFIYVVFKECPEKFSSNKKIGQKNIINNIDYECGNFENFHRYDKKLQELIVNREQIISNDFIFCFENYTKIPIFVLLKKLVKARQNYHVIRELLSGYYEWAGIAILSFSKLKINLEHFLSPPVILSPINPVYFFVCYNLVSLKLQFNGEIYNLSCEDKNFTIQDQNNIELPLLPPSFF